ncbi:hypothetical protein M885DRAFT_623473 [Pelagophyceae sp. CCMP2097]|nr:hypothetical protein M885DRAFT_623473 [Pelagophyceae sp. CCMP2097]
MTSLQLLDAEDEAFLDGLLLDDSEGGSSPYGPTSPQNYHRNANEDDEDEGFVAAWDMPPEMLTGCPTGFEQTRRKCLGLTEQLDDKKKSIDDLLARMARLQSRFAKLATDTPDVEVMLKAAGKAPRRRRAKKSVDKVRAASDGKHSTAEKRGKENERRRGKTASPRRVAHPLDEHPDFQEAVVEEPVVREAYAAPTQPGALFEHPLDGHFELGNAAEDEEDAEALELDEQKYISSVLDWIESCRTPGNDPFGKLEGKISAAFDEIQRTMQKIEGSSTQVFTAKGEETQLLDLLLAREKALEDARDDLELLHDETDDAVGKWQGLYCMDDDGEEDEVLSPEEAKLLLYLGKSLHDYVYQTEEHKHHLLDVAEGF